MRRTFQIWALNHLIGFWQKIAEVFRNCATKTCEFYYKSSHVIHSVWKSQIMSHMSFSILALLQMTCLVCNTVWPQATVFKISPKLTIFGFFNELLSTQNANVARFARNVEWDFFCDFQTQWCVLSNERKLRLYVCSSSHSYCRLFSVWLWVTQSVSSKTLPISSLCFGCCSPVINRYCHHKSLP